MSKKCADTQKCGYDGNQPSESSWNCFWGFSTSDFLILITFSKSTGKSTQKLYFWCPNTRMMLQKRNRTKIVQNCRPRALQTSFWGFSTSDFSISIKKMKSRGNSAQKLYFWCQKSLWGEKTMQLLICVEMSHFDAIQVHKIPGLL